MDSANEKILDLLEKFYTEFHDTRKELKDDIKSLKDDIRSMQNGIIEMENKVADKIGASSDEIKVIKDDVSIIKTRVIEQGEKLHSLRDDVNVLIGRTRRNSYDIGTIKRERGLNI